MTFAMARSPGGSLNGPTGWHHACSTDAENFTPKARMIFWMVSWRCLKVPEVLRMVAVVRSHQESDAADLRRHFDHHLEALGHQVAGVDHRAGEVAAAAPDFLRCFGGLR